MFVTMQKVVDDFGNFFGGYMAIGHIIDLNHRCDGAASEACHFFESEQTFGICIFFVLQFQMPFESIVNQHGAFHMAGSSHTNFNHVQAYRPVPELAVKGRDAHDLRRCDVGCVAQPLQGLLGQVVESLLNLLQNGNGGMLRGSVVADDLVGDILDFLVDEKKLFVNDY